MNARGNDDEGQARLTWLGILRLGLAQAALGAVVVLTTATLNRVMAVEWALPASLPGALVALHYAVQVTRPRFGHGSDASGRRTPWIVGGMAVLSLGGFLAALGTAWAGSNLWGGIALTTAAFVLVGLGVGASGTALLTLLAHCTAPRRRAAAATAVWLMMILGFALTAGIAGALLDPFSPARLVAVSGGVTGLAFLLACAAVWGVEGKELAGARAFSSAGPRIRSGVTRVEASAGVRTHQQRSKASAEPQAIHACHPGPDPGSSGRESASEANTTPFKQALAQVWSEPKARKFCVFVFVSMLAYSAQDLILEPFAGLVFGLTPGQSTQLSGLQHSGVFAGMVLVAVLASGLKRGTLKAWTVGGCLASAAALAALAFGGLSPEGFPLEPAVFALGLANGAFAVAAIGSMMGLAGGEAGAGERREGTRMGLWGGAQAVAFGLGGLFGTASVDLGRALTSEPGLAYGAVFALQAAVFALAAWLASRIEETAPGRQRGSLLPLRGSSDRLPTTAPGLKPSLARLEGSSDRLRSDTDQATPTTAHAVPGE